jgi:hypothetical protein
LASKYYNKLATTFTTLEVDAMCYHQLVGSLVYLTHTHPNISFEVSLIAQYMKTPHEIHWKKTKNILWYIQGTISFGIHYNLGGTPLLVGFTDFDWASDLDD